MSDHDVSSNAGLWGARSLLFPSLPSTNTWALAHAEACGHGDVVRTHHQTAGRGRRGRSWLAPAGRGLAFSIVLRDVPDEAIPVLGLATAVGVAAGLARHGVEPTLKWPNDVLVDGAKCAGILVERCPRSDALIVGIGINVNVEAADLAGDELLYPATSLLLARGGPADPEQVLGATLAELERGYDPLLADPATGLPGILARWQADDALADTTITVATETETVTGAYAGLAPDGRLLLQSTGAALRAFLTGDVIRVRKP